MATIIRSRKAILLLPVFFIQLSVFSSTYGKDNPIVLQAELLQQQLSRYIEIQKTGGWKKIVLDRKQYRKGESAAIVKNIKQRLQVSGDLVVNDTSQVFTVALEEAIKKVQRQFGFNESGVIDAMLMMGLNVPVGERIHQLQVNLQRVRAMQLPVSGRHIVVNIPEYKLHMYEGSNHVFAMNVVVGTEKNRTAIFDEELTHIVFSPYWNVPQSIVRNEILPATRKSKNYLARNGYEVTGHENGLPKIRQNPGTGNSLGLVKFLFPNEHAIYLHDSPAKSLFNHRIRAYSHGCVRLAEPGKLAKYLLKEDAEWTPGKIDEAMNAGKEQWVKLLAAVPVSIIYLTAWVDHEGVLNFRDDVYEMDKSTPIAAMAGI